MKTITDHKGLCDIPRGGVVALGNFDCFHRGHQAVVGEAGRLARDINGPLIVLTTEPHPRSFFAPDQPPFRLMTAETRTAILDKFGVDYHVILTFDQSLASTPAEDFVKTYLLDALGAKGVVTGYDYRFGKGREGDVEKLTRFAHDWGFVVKTVEKQVFGVEGVAGEIYSSSAVRNALRDGKVRHAASLLGHWWSISGTVIHGDKRGRDLGFPTANIAYPDLIVPKHGIYAIRVTTEHGSYDGVANLGTRPTFGLKDILLEAHLFDFDGDLYGQSLDVQMVGFLREEVAFKSVDELIVQMHKDCDTAKAVLRDPENAENHFPDVTLDTYLKSHPVV